MLRDNCPVPMPRARLASTFAIAMALALGTPVGAGADPLAALRARLAALRPAGPFAARIDIRSTGTKGDEDDASRVEKAASVDAVQDGAGIRLQWNAAEIATARRGMIAAERNPEAKKAGGLAELGTLEVAALLDAGPDLLLRLEGAALLESGSENYQGRPATRYTLAMPNTASAKDRKRMKKYDAQLRLWVDAQGWPLAIEEKIHVRYSFMFIGVNLDNTLVQAYTHTEDRLYVTAKTAENSVSGLGQKGGTRSTFKVTPRAG